MYLSILASVRTHAKLRTYVESCLPIASTIPGIGILARPHTSVDAGDARSASSIARYLVPCVTTARVPPQWENKTGGSPRGAAAETFWGTPPQPVCVLAPGHWSDPRRDPSPFPVRGGEYRARHRHAHSLQNIRIVLQPCQSRGAKADPSAGSKLWQTHFPTQVSEHR